jgi:hypothetical protein
VVIKVARRFLASSRALKRTIFWCEIQALSKKSWRAYLLKDKEIASDSSVVIL